jgi:hypothetical protein
MRLPRIMIVRSRLQNSAITDNADVTGIGTDAPGQTRFGISLPLFLFLFIYTLLLFAGSVIFKDPDTYWHIASGRWIIAHGAVPHTDPFSFSMPGAPWTPPEWLAEVLIAFLYDQFGWAGLVVSTALCTAAALALLLRALLRTLTPGYALIATVLAAALVLSHLLARPHIFILPILVLWVATFAAARRKNRTPSLWLVPLMTLWANLHSSYMLGLGLAALLGGEAVLAALDGGARLRAAKSWGLIGALLVAAALITPFGLDGLRLPFRLSNMSSLGYIKEWQSPNFQEAHALEAWILVLLFAAFSLGWRLPPTRIAMLLLLLHLALQHARHEELLGFVAPLLLVPPPPREGSPRGRAALYFDRTMAELLKPARAGGIVLAGGLLLAASAGALRQGVTRGPDAVTPAAALTAVEALHVTGPIFNDYAFGGYLIFAGLEPFIDGRYFYGDAFIARYVGAVFAVDDRLPATLAEFGIAWTLLSPKTPAVAVLDHLPGWRRVYADDVAVVHVRDDQPARPLHCRSQRHTPEKAPLRTYAREAAAQPAGRSCSDPEP